ncbi:uncharacterized protein LOC62_05G007572 [Vanrija pseudolonga]|uniref:Uncharacterized protein n=1 Tax=Vanrija pseudolonga TaxID=143232 RepID=A0AAF0YFJ4_9TREE|nr:hypothetical protein LOC62_05G007572 [Vanrija pseudolonga]
MPFSPATDLAGTREPYHRPAIAVATRQALLNELGRTSDVLLLTPQALGQIISADSVFKQLSAPAASTPAHAEAVIRAYVSSKRKRGRTRAHISNKLEYIEWRTPQFGPQFLAIRDEFSLGASRALLIRNLPPGARHIPALRDRACPAMVGLDRAAAGTVAPVAAAPPPPYTPRRGSGSASSATSDASEESTGASDEGAEPEPESPPDSPTDELVAALRPPLAPRTTSEIARAAVAAARAELNDRVQLLEAARLEAEENARRAAEERDALARRVREMEEAMAAAFGAR